jgi:3-hydroxybutyryl-CoA dehydratase
VVRLDFTITPRQMRTFRQLSGDSNPIHFDQDFARSRGFEEPIVYGGLVVAQISRILGTQLPGPGCVWQSMAMRFRRPLYVGRMARMEATIKHEASDIGVFVVEIVVTCNGLSVAEGEAMAMLPRPRERAHDDGPACHRRQR